MNIREPLERAGKWHRYQEAVEAQDWTKVRDLLLGIGCTREEIKSILWSLHAPGTETEVETTSDKIIGRVGFVLVGAVGLGLLFAWQASGFGDLASDKSWRRQRAMGDYRPWKPVVGTAFACGALLGGGAAAAHLYRSAKRKRPAAGTGAGNARTSGP